MTFNTTTALLRTLLCSALLAVAACGGADVASDDSAGDLATSTGPFEPFAHFASVQKAAARYAKSPVAVSLHGVRSGDAMQTNSAAYTWTWTLMGQDGIYVDIQSGKSGNKVLAHEKRYTFVGMGTFNPKNVAVNGDDVVQLVMKAGLSQPADLTLGAGLSHPMTPTWTATCGAKVASVNAETGDLAK